MVFLGTKPIGYHCLEYAIRMQEVLNFDVIAVGTKSRTEFGNAYDLTVLAKQHGIPILDRTDDMPACDIIYSVQYHEILRPNHFDRASTIAVNLHMAPLPEYRGCNQFSFAIINGDKEFGVTIHAIDEGIDSGDILFESRFLVPPDIWVDGLYERTFNVARQLFSDTLPDLLTGNYVRQPQADWIPGRGCSIHYRKEIHKLKQIDLSWPKEQIERYVRATFMPGFEPPYCIIGHQKIYFTRPES